jgi:hypothetical protein
MDKIDWQGIRAAAVQLGVREAARRAGADLPPIEQNRFVERVLKRSTREGWTVEKLALIAQGNPRQSKPLSANVHSGSSVMQNALAEHSTRSRLGLAKATTKASEHLAELPPQLILAQAGRMRDVAATAGNVHNWNADQRPGSPLNLQVLSQQTVISIGEKDLHP